MSFSFSGLKRWLLLLPLLFLFSGCTNILDKTNKSGLQVLTPNIAASVFLDDQYLDKTPHVNKELKPGQYTLRIEPGDDSLIPYQTTVNLRKGLLTVVTWKPGTTPELSGGVTYELEKSASKQTELSIISIPDGAVVSIDGGEKDFTPVLSSDLSPGPHDISVTLPSYETQSHTINIVEGHRLNVSVKLAKNPDPADEETQVTESVPSATASATAQDSSASSSASTLDLNPKPTATPSLPSSVTQPLSNSSIDGASVTINSTGFFVEGKEVLRVRDQAGATGKELGFAPVGQSYSYLGETNLNWHSIDFEGQTGWVSGQYATLEE